MPSARALADMRAMAASLLIRLFSVIRSREKSSQDHHRNGYLKGDHPMARAMERAPKDTWDKPSPIMLYRLSTRLTPSRDAHRIPSCRPQEPLPETGGKAFLVSDSWIYPPCACAASPCGIRLWACICPVPFMEEMAGCLAVHIVVGRPGRTGTRFAGEGSYWPPSTRISQVMGHHEV